tara:strand:+ start:1052 stop:1540 length:489 start_codon:yes stop_codon:yes gene_type:complete
LELINLKIIKDEKIFSSFHEINKQQVPKVGSVSLQEFINLIKISDISYGIIKKGICLGFVICLRENTNYQSINYKFFQKRHKKFFYIDRIAIATKYQSSGIGSNLYNKLLFIKEKFNIPLCAEVNIDPPNELSINFHRKHGFSEIIESTIKEGYSVVYMEVC